VCDSLAYILNKFHISDTAPSPIKLPMTRRNGLLVLFRELGFKTGAEIGVEAGDYSWELCRAIPGIQLYCIDPWEAYARYKDIREQPKMDRLYSEAVARLSKFNCKIIRKSSMEAVKDFAPESLDFVYIDANHDFEHVVNDIIHWSKIVRKGGIVAGHDYRTEDEKHRAPFHVIQAVTAYTDAYNIRPVFIVKKDICPSFMWVKPQGE